MLKLATVLGTLILFNFAYGEVQKSYSTSTLAKDRSVSYQERLWLQAAGPLNRVIGVSGSRGVLGYLGPFGRNWWNVTPVFEAMGNWQELANTINQMGGPISEMGPLLTNTVFGNFITSFDFIPGSGDILAAGGILMSLGPSGIMSPLGIGGVLGPHGGHGFEIGDFGQFLNEAGKIVRKIRVPTIEGRKTYELFEYYKGSFARLMINDTSFMAEDMLEDIRDSHTYVVRSSKNQWVNLTLINLFDLDTLKLTVLDKENNIIAESSDATLTNFIALKVTAGTTFKVKIECKNSLQIYKKPYRLNVIGSNGNYSVKRPFQK